MKSEKRPIEIEDLLRLKRAERPPAEFWAQFDRELRAKQLSALVAKRPWWQRLPRVFIALRPYHLPLGAAAVLTVTFVTLRDGQDASSTSVAGKPVARQAVIMAMPEVVTGVVQVAREVAAPRFVAAIERSAPVAKTSLDVAVVTPEATPVEMSTSSEPARNSLLATTGTEFGSTDAGAGLRHIGAALTVTPAAEPMVSRSLMTAASTGFEARGLPVRLAVEPLQQITPPSERSRMKLLTAMVSMSASDAASRTGERAADRISEERLYDQVSRFGARGAGVSMKF